MPIAQETERRRTIRIALKVNVTLSGVDANGSKFVEETETVMVSKHGSSVRTSHTLALGQQVSVLARTRNRAGLFEVVWVGKPGTPNEGLVGLEWIEAQRLWGVDFPPVIEESNGLWL